MNRKRLGRALVEAWFDYTPSPFDPDTIHKAVVFMPKSIGDGMGIYPAIRALQARGVEWLGVVASARNAPIYESLKGEGVEVFVVPHDRAYAAVRQAARRIRRSRGRIDLCVEGTALATSPAIHFVGTLKARMNLQLSGSHMRLYAPMCNALARDYLKASPPQNWAALMKLSGIADVPGRFELPIPLEIDREMADWLAPLGRYIAFNLDGSIDKRRIPSHKAEELLEAVHRQTGMPIVIPYDPHGREKALALSARLPFVHAYSGATSILHSAAIIARSAMLISPDTAAIHIASAHDRPTLGIYRRLGPVWQPRASQYVVFLTEGPLEHIDTARFMHDLASLTSRLPDSMPQSQ